MSADGVVAPQLSFQIVNTAGGDTTPNVIFITKDDSYNKVSLQLSLSSGSAQLSPGTIPDPATPPTTGTTLYLDLSQLQLAAGDWDKIAPSATDWTFQKFPSENVIGMTPTSPITVKAGPASGVSIEIDGIVVPAALAQPTVQLYVVYYGIPAVTGMYASFPVAIQNPPDAKGDLSDALIVSLDSSAGVVNSLLNLQPPLQAANLFALQFASKQNVVANAGPETLFTVTFVYGAPHDDYGFGALTDVANAIKIGANPGQNADQWIITQNKDSQSPFWTLQPPDGDPIAGTGVEAIVAINFSNIVTTYQPGPTLMLISYKNVPTYRDGTFAIVLNKVAHAAITALAVTPNPAYFSGGQANAVVSWKVNDARGLELTQNFATNPVTGTQVPVVLASESTAITLKAIGAAGTVENVDYRNITAIALPVINSFTGAPTEIFSGSLSHDANFAWAVDSSDGVTLSSTQGAFSGQQFDASGHAPAEIDLPQMVTLAPTTAANPLTLTRKLVISAFTPTPKNFPLAFSPSAAAASPSGPFAILAGPSNSLTVLDTVQYSAAGTVGLGFQASALAFSPDGTVLATANTDGSVSAVGVTLGANGMPSFGAPSNVPLTGKAQQLAISPNGARIFVTVDPGGGANGQVFSLLGASGSYQVEGMVAVGKAPRGLAFDPAGTRLYVANSGNDTVSVIGLTPAGALGGIITTVHELTGAPTGVAVTPSGQQLLVSCANAGTVIAVDPNHPDTGQRRTLNVGKSPGQIAVTPSGSYAFIANAGDGTLSLIDCWGLPSRASVVGSAIQVGTQPSGVTVSADGLQVFVAASNAFTLVTLATYHAPTAAPGIPNRPTHVACTPDGSSFFAWHDATIPAQSPSPGILVYTLSNGMISNALASAKVTRCVISPDPLTREAYAIVQNDPLLHIIATDSLQTTTIDLGLAAGTIPIALGISGEGRTLFMVVADKSRNMSLVVVRRQDLTWTAAQTLSLYQATSAGRILVHATPDGTAAFVVDVAAATVRVLKQGLTAYALSSTVITGDSGALDVAILPDGSTAYVLNAGQQNNTITVIDIASLNATVAAIPQSYVDLTALEPSPDGRRLFATDSNAAALRVLDPKSLRILQTIPLASGSTAAQGIMGVAVAADGSKIFTANTVSQNVSIVEQIQMGTSAPASVRSRFVRSAAMMRAADGSSSLFMRHYLGEIPGAPNQGWASSPDVIPYGQTIQPDLSTFTSPAGYGTDFEQDVPVGVDNQVYVRGLNTTNAPLKSRAYFYYIPSGLALWPANWRFDRVTVNTVTQNWVDIQSPSGGPTNGVGVAPVPLLWNPPQLPDGSDHFCIAAWVDSSANPQPPDFAHYAKFATFDDLVNFVLTHHNLAWRNTHEVTAPPPDYKYSAGLTMQSGGGSVFLNVQFVNIPSDGCFAVNLQGTDSTNTIALPRTPLQTYQGGYSPRNNPLTFPPNFATSIQIYHWPGATPLPSNARITVSLGVQTGPALMRDIARLYRPLGLRSPFVRIGSIPMAIVGSVGFNLKFGASRA